MLTQPYAFNAEEARAMAKAGCDLLIAHMGIQTKAMKQRGQGMDLAAALSGPSSSPTPPIR